ncbi:MAG: DUF6689 family protein [Rhodanobacteraceae bacterium]
MQKRWPKLSVIAVAAILLLQSAAACAGGVVVTIIDGRKAKADITLPNPNGGDYTAEFEIEFERDGLENLTVECVGITADVLDASEIDDVQQRLPHGTQPGGGGTQLIDAAFPVRITVEPPAGCGLAFRNGYDVEIDTPNLVYVANSKYRFMKAPLGQMFQYVTASVTSGSVRSRGSSGGFSEFVLIADTAPQYAPDCNHEYDYIETRLQASALSPTARRTLEIDLARSRAAYDAGDFAAAIALLAAFDGHCVEYAGEGLPNEWRSTRDLDNVEGDIVGRTDNLRFMMGRLNGSP